MVKGANCDKRGQDNDACHTLFECPEGWDQVVVFVALIMCYKMELVRERQRRPTAAATQHSMPDLANPPPLAASNPATDKDIHAD